MGTETIVNKKINPWKLGFSNLPQLLKVLLSIAVFIVMIYHIQQYSEQTGIYLFTLKKPLYTFFKVSSEFLSKLAFAVITSTIFYFITQQLPKENKRIKFADNLFNIFGFVQGPFRDLETALFQDGDIVKIPSLIDDYKNHCSKILYSDPVRPNLQGSITWETLILKTIDETLEKIDEIDSLSDLLDTKTYISLQTIKSHCLTLKNLLSLRNRGYVGDSKTLSYGSDFFFQIRKELIAFNGYAEAYNYCYKGVYVPLNSM